MKFLSYALLLALTLLVPWSMIGDEVTPQRNLFGIIVLIDVCIVCGWIISKIPMPKLPPLPPLFGMLLAGFALANIPVINVAAYIHNEWSSALRSIALAVILVKAGLDLDASALSRMKGACIRLTVIPCFVETATCGVVCHLLLGFPWAWGFLLGFVLGAVTPAVIVPSLLALQKKGYGVAKGIPSLVIAASSFDDVLAISGFSLILGIVFSDVSSIKTDDSDVYSNLTAVAGTTTNETSNYAGEIAMKIFRGPLEMIGGILISILFGVGLWFLPDSKQKGVVMIRSVIVVSIGVFSIGATGYFGVPGAGALIAIVTPFVAGKKWNDTKEQISENVGLLWILFEPVMFGLIGAEIRLDRLDSSTVGLGIATLVICLIFRTCGTFGAVSCANFDLREKIFLCLAWLPKATVQAAIGGMALDTARKMDASEEVIERAEKVLAISVLSILITAPLGAAAIGLSGPKLLSDEVKDEQPENNQLETIQGDELN